MAKKVFDDVAIRGYIIFMKVVGIRELKDRLSDYLRTVRTGEAVLVTDRGQAIAEISPLGRSALPKDTHPNLVDLSRQGRVSLGAPNDPELYPHLPPIMPKGSAARWLNELRGDH